MTEWYVALPATLLLIVLSAFFVILEFSLLAARRNRLEQDAETSATSRAALRSLNELTLMLAGAQLGITACTFALGAVTKPWVHHALMPVFEATGLPSRAADIIAFVVALFVVTFLHLVVGEMAPKSWAITHPEFAARMVAIPARGFMYLFRPLLHWINHIANRLVAAAGEVPVERAAARGYDAQALRTLVEHSRETGALEDSAATQISGVIELEHTSVEKIVRATHNTLETLGASATAGDVQRATGASGRSRVLLYDDSWETPRVVHVRDTLKSDPASPAVSLSRPCLTIAGTTPVKTALELMRGQNEQLAVVVSEDPHPVVEGVLTWDDILAQLWPTIEHELDRA